MIKLRTLDVELTLPYRDGLKVITKAFKHGGAEGRRQKGSEQSGMGRAHPALAGGRGRGHEPRNEGGPENWKRRALPQSLQKGRKPGRDLDLQSAILRWDFWPMELEDNYLCCCKPPSVVICYSGKRK